MASTAKPTVFFIHGAWHSPVHFAPIRSLLERDGYPTACPCQPTFDAQPPTLSMYEDAKFTRAELETLVDKDGKDVIVVMHSYGGVVGTEAVHESLGKKTREEKRLPGGILRLVFLCAFVVPEGMSLGGALGGGLPPFIPVAEDGGCMIEDPERRFYNDLSPSDQQKWTKELRVHPSIAQLQPTTYSAYKYHPVTYLFCEKDEALPVALQRMMIENAGIAYESETCEAGHSPFLSQQEAVVNLIKKIKA